MRRGRELVPGWSGFGREPAQAASFLGGSLQHHRNPHSRKISLYVSAPSCLALTTLVFGEPTTEGDAHQSRPGCFRTKEKRRTMKHLRILVSDLKNTASLLRE